jgi:hypothetical protein
MGLQFLRRPTNLQKHDTLPLRQKRLAGRTADLIAERLILSDRRVSGLSLRHVRACPPLSSLPTRTVRPAAAFHPSPSAGDQLCAALSPPPWNAMALIGFV